MVPYTTVNWQVTATTLYCDAVHDEVTLLVYRDGSAKCTGYAKYGGAGEVAIGLSSRKDRLSKQLNGCGGPLCHRMIEYRERLFSEEAKRDCA
jgi:hypothetical protein